MTSDGLRAATDKMREAEVPDLAIRVFADYHEQLRRGVAGTIPEDSIEPLVDVPHLDVVHNREHGVWAAWAHSV